jgi:hypothetical protein
LKALYALVFVLVSFAAPAQTLESWIAAYHLDDLDCLGEGIPPQIIGVEVFCPAMLNDADGLATAVPNGVDDVAPGSIQPRDEGSTVNYSTGDDETLTGDETVKQGVPVPMVAPERSIEKLGEGWEDGVADIGPNEAENVPVGAIQARDQNSTINYLTGRDDKQAIDDTAEKDATPTQIIATQPSVDTVGEAKLNEADDVAVTGPRGSDDVPVGAIQPSNEDSTAANWSRSDDQSAAYDTIE